MSRLGPLILGVGTTSEKIALSVPPWVAANAAYQNGATMITDWTQPNGDGTSGQTFLAPDTIVNAATIWARTGTGGTAFDASGNLVTFTGTALRSTSAGLTTEEARTNGIRNNTMQGTAPGTPGTPPTNWGLTTGGGISSTVVGTGVEGGVPYLDVRFLGMATSTATLVTFFETPSGTAAATGQPWTSSFFLKLQAGTLTGIASAFVGFNEYNSGGASVKESQAALPSLPTNAPLPSGRFVYSATTSGGATTAFIAPYMYFIVSSGSTVDATFRFGAPQMEQGAFATTPILTSGTAVTRPQDYISANNAAWLFQNAGTQYIATTPEQAGGTTLGRMLSISDGTNSNFFDIYQSTAAIVGQTPIIALVSSYMPTAGTAFKAAFAQSSSQSAIVANGGAASTGSNGAIPGTLTSAYIGNRVSGDRPYSGVVPQNAYFPLALTTTQLQAITQ